MTDDDKSKDDMNAQEQQNYFNELAEKMMRGEITADEAIDIYKRQQKRLEEAEEEVRCIERRWEKSCEKVKTLTEQLAALRDTERHIIIPCYWYVDEETGEKVYDTDEMESEFHDALVDLGAYNDELRCMECDKQFGKTESWFHNAEGLAVCDDCFKGEESGEE